MEKDKKPGFFAILSANKMSLRVASALAMVGVAAAAFCIGPAAVKALMLVAAALMLWEYAGMFSCPRTPSGWLGVFGASAILAAFCACCASYSAHWFAAALVVLFCVVLLCGIFADGSHWLLESVSPLYIGLPMLAALYIFEHASAWALVYIFAITVSTDTGAFVIGSLFGGPKLAPSISPKKTWSGAIGGVFCAFVFGTALQLALLWRSGGDFRGLAPWALISALLSVVAQAGDLFESKVKRISGVKDSSGLIPGHGGFLDRFDSFLFVAPFVALIVAFSRLGAPSP
jgi:phosphatidate cytidylyltransferase